MFQRKMMERLLEWKSNHKKECLVVKGARQVGKTYLIREFGKKNYKHYLEFNFLTNPEQSQYFNGNLDAAEIIKKIKLDYPEIEFVAGQTLLFLDEIEECGNARTALKFIAESELFDCIASGSMLGVSYKQIRSIPVGYEKQIEMFAMDFEEFLWAKGLRGEQIGDIREYFTKRQKVDFSFNITMFKYLKEFIIVGGMPKAVETYLTTNDFSRVHGVQQSIIDSYLDDIAKYAREVDKPKARACYLSLPAQLAKENKKFQYGVVEKGGTARKFDSSLEWLRDAGLIKFCTNVSKPEFPLVSYEKHDYFKVYASDIGILVAMHGYELKSAIYNDKLVGQAKGAIYENLIADFLLKKYIPLRYYKPAENRQEIEFLLTGDAEIIPVEVKAGNGSTNSLNEYIKEFNPSHAIKLINGNIGVTDTKITLPLYMAMFL